MGRLSRVAIPKGTYGNLDSDSYKDFTSPERDLVFQASCKQRMLSDLGIAVKLRRSDHLSRKFST